MYYRKSDYPRDGHADVPDNIWSEMQRIRSHLASVDQNNVAPEVFTKSVIISPRDKDHNGISDVVGSDGSFLYEQRIGSVIDPIKVLKNSHDGSWYDLGRKGLRLEALSRGDAPWIVGTSLSARVTEPERINHPLNNPTNHRDLYLDAEFTITEIVSEIRRDHGRWQRVNLWDASARRDEEQRGVLRLKARCSQGGHGAAEGVGGISSYQQGCSIAAVSCFFVRGGPVEFSPSVMLRSLLNETDWRLGIVQANIFAFALYR